MFTVQEVDRAYTTLLNPASDPNIRSQANEFLMKFQESDEAWKISLELVNMINENAQFLGSQVLYHKLQTNIEYLKTGADLISVRDNLLLLFERDNIFKKASEKLCLCLGAIGVHTWASYWESMIQDLVGFAQKSEKNCLIVLTIFANFASEVDEAKLSHKSKMRLKTKMREEGANIMELTYQVASNPQLSHLSGGCLSALKGWSEACGEQILTHSGICQMLLRCMENENLLGEVVEILQEAISHSPYVRILESCTLSEATERLQKSQILVFIKSVIGLMEQKIGFLFSERLENDFYSTWSQKWAEVASIIIENFTLILFTSGNESKTLISFLILCLKHKNKTVAYNTFDGWIALKEHIIGHAMELEITHLYESFYLLLKEMINTASCPILNIPSSDHEDDDMSTEDFRLFAADIIFNSYYLLQKKFGKEGQKSFFQMIAENLQKVSEARNETELFLALRMAESCYFSSSSILDALDLETEPNEYIKYLLLEIGKIPQKQNFQRTALLFIMECTSQMEFYPELITPSLQYCIQCSSDHKLQSVACRCVYEIVTSPKLSNLYDNLSLVSQYLSTNFATLEIEGIGRISKALGMQLINIELQQQDLEYLIKKILGEPVSSIISFNMPLATDSIKLLAKYLTILVDFLKPLGDTLEHARQKQIKQNIISPIINECWPKLNTLLLEYAASSDIVLLISNIINRTFAFFGIPSAPLFPQIVGNVLQAYQINPKNHSCIQVLTFSFTCLFEDPTFQKSIKEGLPNIIMAITSKIDSANPDPDIIGKLAEFLARTIEYVPMELLQFPSLNEILNLLCICLAKFRSYDQDKSILTFLKYIISMRHESYINFITPHITQISQAILLSLPTLSRQLLLSVALVVSALVEFYKDQAIQGITTALQQPPFTEVSVKVKTVFLQCLPAYFRKTPSMKLLIQDLTGIIKNTSDEDVFMCHELKLKMFENAQQKQKTTIVLN